MKKSLSVASIVSFVIPWSVGMAATPVYIDQLRQAAIFEEAGQFDRSIAIYNQLRLAVNSHEEQNLIQFDIGTIYLFKGEYDRAIAELSNISLGNDSPPLLRFRIYYNLALAFYQGVEKGSDDDRELLSQLDLALSALEKSANARCELEGILNHPECHLPAELIALKDAIKRRMAQLRQSIELKQGIEQPLIENLAWLSDSITHFLDLLAPLEAISLEFDQADVYGKFFSEELERWHPLLEQMTKSFHLADKEMPADAAALFDRGKRSFYAANQSFQEADLEKGSIFLKGAKTAFAALLQKLTSARPLNWAIQHLIDRYKRLSLVTVSPNSLKRLESGYVELGLTKGEGAEGSFNLSPDTAAMIKEGLAELLEAKKALNRSDEKLAALHLLASKGALRMALTTLSPPTPLSQIELMIANQQQAIAMVEWQMAVASLQNDPEAVRLTEKSQEEVVHAAPLFWKVLKEEQTRAYLEEKKCQAVPWVKALPLLNQGLISADKSYLFLQNHHSLRLALNEQQLALESLKKARHEILHPDGRDNPCQENSSGAGNEGESSQGELLQKLQEMYQEDEKMQKQPSVKFNEKPW